MDTTAPSAGGNPTKPFWLQGVFVFFFAFCIHFAGTWILPLQDRDEPRFAEASREMRERQDWFVPYFNNEYRFDKPPLTYWAEALSSHVFGESDWSVRLPSVLASALTSLLIFLWGKRAVGENVGFWAAIIYSTSLQVFVHSKFCVADPYMVLFVAAAAWAGWEMIAAAKINDTRASIFWNYFFFIALALGFLAKGPIACLPIGMLAVARLRRFKGSPGWLQVGLLLLATLEIVALWAFPALKESHGKYLSVGMGEHVIARGLTTFEGHGGGLKGYFLWLPYYFVTVLFSFFPWSILLPWFAKCLWSQRKKFDELTVYLLSGIGLVFGIFTFYNTRLPHYTLPAFPMLALLLAREWFQAGRRTKFLRWSASIMTVASLIVAFTLFPFIRRNNLALQLVQLSAGSLKREMEFAAVEFREPSLVWYFRAKVHGYFSLLKSEAIVEFMAKPGPRFCVVPVSDAEEIFPVLPENCHVVGDVSGLNLVYGKRVQLRLIIKPD